MMLRSRLAGFGLIGLGLGAAVASLLGPLGFNVIDWRISADMENQLLGQDAVTLALAAPLLVTAGVLWLAGHRVAPLLAIGPAMYGLYTFTSMIFFPEYDRYAGNNEKAFPLWIGLTILSWAIGAKAWSAIDPASLPSISTRLRRWLGVTLLILGGLIALAWGQQVAMVMSGDVSLIEYQEHPTGFWLVKTYDLAFVVPIQMATGIGLLRGHPLAVKTAFGVTAFSTIIVAAVASMGIVMLVRDDPSATVVFPAILTPVTLLLTGLTAALFRTYLRAGRVESHDEPVRPAPAGRTAGFVPVR